MILVAGASGSNGTEIVKRLSGTGAAVRAMVRTRRDDAKSILTGVEISTADFDQPERIRRVLEGVDRAFLVTNSSEHVETEQLHFVQLSHEAGVRHIVYLSQLHVSKDSPVRFLRYQARHVYLLKRFAVERSFHMLSFSCTDPQTRAGCYIAAALCSDAWLLQSRFHPEGEAVGVLLN